ncbi:MAG: T9SS type A sorting domain-containing protein [Candidatus Cloacimonetes bacterium]|nr:T9SS type A sorting domain-containing protein [Candidatus Cloacimonadota bacterium]
MIIFIFKTVFAQIPNWQQVSQAGGNDWDVGYSLTTDNSGNTYVTGVFEGTATFGSYYLTSYGLQDIFVAKIDTNGNWIWSNQANGLGWNSATGIVTDNDENVYVTGHFLETTTFGEYSLTSNGGSDIFVAKLNSDGNWIWATKAGGVCLDRSYGISLDSEENIYIAGHFEEESSFGQHSLTSNGADDVFIAKLNTSGNWMWARNAGGIDDDRGFDLIMDNDGNNYITGYFQETATFGSQSITSNGSIDIFLAKISSDGNWIGVTQAGGSNEDSGYGVTMNDTGSIYLTGMFSDIANFGTLSLTSNGESDIFVAKLNSNNSIEDCTIIAQYDLSNYPNPFNPTTTISFSIPKESKIDLSVFNIKGHKIKSLLKESIEAGIHSVIWNGVDESGKPVSSGVYFYKLSVNGKSKAVKKCLLLK